MNIHALRELIRQQPFEPFELILSSGDRYPVKHPEMMLVLKSRVVIGLDADNRHNVPERSVSVSYLHIAGAEPLRPRRSGKSSKS